MSKNKTVMIKTQATQPLMLCESVGNSVGQDKFIFKGVFTACSDENHTVVNRNNRIYPLKEMMRHMGYLREQIKNHQLYGELDHPTDRFETSLKEAAIKLLTSENNLYTIDDIPNISNLKEIWGKDMEEALIAIKDIKISKDMITVYRKTTNTLKITLPNKISLMKFNATDEECDRLQNQTGAYIQLEIVGKCNINEWMGNITPQIFIEDYDITGEGRYLF